MTSTLCSAQATLTKADWSLSSITAVIGTVRGFRRDGITRSLFQQLGAAATTLACRRKNGLTTPAGSISGQRLAATRFICRSKSQPLSIEFPVCRLNCGLIERLSLRHPENLSCVWIFHGGPGNKGADIDV